MRATTPPLPAAATSAVAPRSFGLLSTYPPTVCGLATFTAALSRGLEANGADVGVVRVADGAIASDPRVLAELAGDGPSAVTHAADCLNDHDMAIIQHEYGIYGGRDGEDVLDVMAQLTVPSIVVAHTVLLDPTDHQRQVLESVAEMASAVVVMTEAARDRLLERFDVEPAKVVTIPHGAATPPIRDARDLSATPTVLTWGLIGRGKGIEWAIDAMVDLQDLAPRPRYVIAGRTHPKVLAFEGEAYRDMLTRRARTNGVSASVSFDPGYRDLPSLMRLIQNASVVVLPYDSRDQVTSGVLVDAIAAGRPVVATAFPHAVELLSSGAGIVVPHEDPAALAAAVRRVLTEPGLAASMASEAARLAPQLGWRGIAGRYGDLADQTLRASEPIST
jgi:glycosyltransferase involved in cell wall biosynthesis